MMLATRVRYFVDTAHQRADHVKISSHAATSSFILRTSSLNLIPLDATQYILRLSLDPAFKGSTRRLQRKLPIIQPKSSTTLFAHHVNAKSSPNNRRNPPLTPSQELERVLFGQNQSPPLKTNTPELPHNAGSEGSSLVEDSCGFRPTNSLLRLGFTPFKPP